MRNPTGKIPGQKWTGDDDEDYEQSCMPLDAKIVGGDNMPGRSTIAACNYTCLMSLISRSRVGSVSNSDTSRVRLVLFLSTWSS